MPHGIKNKQKLPEFIEPVVSYTAYSSKNSRKVVLYMCQPYPNELAKQFSGKLLLRSEIPLDEHTFQQLLASSYFTPMPPIKRKGFVHQCQRCGNQKHFLFAELPCASCETPHLYCRKCIEMGRIMACEPLYYWTGTEAEWDIHKAPCTWQGKLTTEQTRAAERMRAAIGKMENELLVWAVTGAGKTEMLFPCINDCLKQGKRICIATPRADVVRELLPRIRQAFAKVSVQGLYSTSEDKSANAQIIISTTHQLFRYRSAFDLMIIDEIDAFPFHADPSLPFAAKRAKKSGGTMIYLTATPSRKHRLFMASNKLPSIFVPKRFHGYPLPVPQFKMCFHLKKDLQKYRPPYNFMEWLKRRKNPERQLLLFVPVIDLAEKMQGKLADLLISEGVLQSRETMAAVHAEDEAREEKVQLFRDREISVLLTTTILERGVTFPSVDVAVLHADHAVFDDAALVQIAGRAGRSPDDPDGEVIFFHEGKTKAMVQAADAIISMNRRGGF